MTFIYSLNDTGLAGIQLSMPIIYQKETFSYNNTCLTLLGDKLHFSGKTSVGAVLPATLLSEPGPLPPV